MKLDRGSRASALNHDFPILVPTVPSKMRIFVCFEGLLAAIWLSKACALHIGVLQQDD